jgi:hypothetical protein
MIRKFLVLALLIALMGQSVSMARTGLTLDFLADLQHAVLHWQGEGHHHHDDGAYHQDDSSESAQHMIADYVMASPALLAGISTLLPALGASTPALQRTDFVPHPFLEGPLRSPRSTT